MTAKLIFTPTVDDLKAAYALHLKQAGWKRTGYFIAFGAVMGAVIVAINGFEGPVQALPTVGAMIIWAALVAGLLQFLLPIVWVPRFAKKIHKQQKNLRLETETWWDDEKLHSKNAQGTAFLEFADMIKWRADDNILLFYQSDNLFNFLPIRAFKDKSLLDGLIRRLQDAGIAGERK